MQQKNSTKQSRSRTRNQRKRELHKTICMSAALIVVWAMALTMMVKSWVEHPAEQPVNGYEYMETIGGESYGNPQD